MKDNQEQSLNFYKLIEELNKKIADKLVSLDVEQEKNTKNNKLLEKISKLVGYFPSVTYHFMLIGTLLLGAVSCGLLINESFQMFNSFNRLGMLTDLNQLGISCIAVSGMAILGGAGYLSSQIYKQQNAIYDYLGNVKDQIQNKIFKRKSRNKNGSKINDITINRNEKFLEKTKDADECYNYMILSTLKTKKFSMEDVDIIYELLKYHDISTLIYLLYNDRLDMFKSMTLTERLSYEQKIDINGKISDVKAHVDKIKQRQKQNHNNSMEITREMIINHNKQPLDMIIDIHDEDEEIKESRGK